VSAYPIALDGARVDAVIVGGGGVAERKAKALLESGARVRIIATSPSAAVRALAGERCTVDARPFAPSDLSPNGTPGRTTVVVAATDRAEVNARVVDAARALGMLVNVADHPGAGTFVTLATHRAGDLVVAVSAGGVPGVAARVRDAIGTRFDARYGAAVSALARLRRRLLDAGARDDWRRASASLVDEAFCETVESGAFTQELAAWR
jgi:precorrin-2 dehydrogenase/sirohydrochlorin ferrochelatase